MKIAYIGIKGLPSKGGAERVVEALVKRISVNHQVTVYCSSHYTPPNFKLQNVELIRIKGLPGKVFRMLTVDLIAAFHAILFRKYDLIHLHNIEASIVLPILRFKYPVIATAHGRFTKGNKWNSFAVLLLNSIEYLFAQLASASTSVSAIDARYLSMKCHRIVHYIPNGIDDEEKVDLAESKKILKNSGLNIDTDEYFVFVAGRIIPLKGAHVLLGAFQQLGSTKKLIIIGDLSQAHPAYSRMLKSMSNENVIYIPFISNEYALFGIIKMCSLFIMPSISEGMSMALLEAAALGVPIICSNIHANKAVLDNDHALFFKVDDSNDLKSKIEWAMQNPEIVKAMGLKAQNWVRGKFSWDNLAQQYDELYHSFA
ncbi:MAG: glycosyltransferase family 4 protein [Deltaproteobacteria bacterium]|nr:glycosyltransferase family 4 protein [Deltaproteobacteria bacterium]